MISTLYRYKELSNFLKQGIGSGGGVWNFLVETMGKMICIKNFGGNKYE